ncbi:MAG: TetR/AcrR family transcriptional regulator [Desulfobacterales bacterium]|jgi:AcrR family transcriptional regulator|nr:TetR/AcrR family transcriptional regulator [Desulfobacterales bacterium]
MNSSTPSKSERTRQFIIEKAAPVFNKKGIAGTSLTDLTHATGLTKGSIYGNFKDKDELAVEVFKYNICNIESFFSHEMDKAKTSAEKLMVYPRIYRKIYKAMIAYGGCPILNTATEADDTHHALCKLVAQAVTRWKKQIMELIDTGIKTGEVQPGTDATAISEIIISLFEGGGILAKVTGEETYMKNTLDHMEQLIQSIII